MSEGNFNEWLSREIDLIKSTMKTCWMNRSDFQQYATKLKTLEAVLIEYRQRATASTETNPAPDAQISTRF